VAELSGEDMSVSATPQRYALNQHIAFKWAKEGHAQKLPPFRHYEKCFRKICAT